MVFPKALLIIALLIGSPLPLVIIWNNLLTVIELLKEPPIPAQNKTIPPSRSSNKEKSTHIM